jgi:GNAT superfamily N-acetyltransferase
MTAFSWQKMLPAHLARVKVLADRVHPGLPERVEVFADRLAAFPGGSRVLVSGGAVAGYAVSHPAQLFEPPPLDHLLGAVGPEADSYYIHDVVVAPELRGQGLARLGVEAVLAAVPYPTTALVSVYGTMSFWAGFGFIDESDALLAGKLAPYGADARYMVRRTPLVGDIFSRNLDVLQRD